MQPLPTHRAKSPVETPRTSIPNQGCLPGTAVFTTSPQQQHRPKPSLTGGSGGTKAGLREEERALGYALISTQSNFSQISHISHNIPLQRIPISTARRAATTYMPVLIQCVVGELQLLEGDGFFHPVAARSWGIGVDIGTTRQLGLCFSSNFPLIFIPL